MTNSTVLTGFGPIVKCYTDRNDPIRAESYKAAKASTLLSIMGHWEFCTKALPMIISYYVIVFKEKSDIIIKIGISPLIFFHLNQLFMS